MGPLWGWHPSTLFRRRANPDLSGYEQDSSIQWESDTNLKFGRSRYASERDDCHDRGFRFGYLYPTFATREPARATSVAIGGPCTNRWNHNVSPLIAHSRSTARTTRVLHSDPTPRQRCLAPHLDRGTRMMITAPSIFRPNIQVKKAKGIASQATLLAKRFCESVGIRLHPRTEHLQTQLKF